MSDLQARQVSLLVSEAVLMNQLILLTCRLFLQWRLEVDQIKRGEVVAFEKVDEVGGGVENGTVTLLQRSSPQIPALIFLHAAFIGFSSSIG